MKKTIPKILAAALIAVVTGCGPKTAERPGGEGAEPAKEQGGAHGDHDDHGEEAEGAKFAEGKGITLMEETKKSIGLKMVEAEERKLTPIVPIEAQVFRTAAEPSRLNGEKTGSSYASALLPSRLANKLKLGDSATLKTHEADYPASVWRVDTASKEAVNSEEVIVEIPDPKNTLKVGDFVSGSVTQSAVAESVVTVPRSAVLATATGKFAYVENGSHLLRTPVTTGAESADYIEITDGLYTGDIVASQPVESLYLIELRATKGGGHSH